MHLREDRRVVFRVLLEIDRLKSLAKVCRTLDDDRSETKQKNGNDDNDVQGQQQ